MPDGNTGRNATVKFGEVEPPGQSCEEFFPPPCCMVIFGASGDLVSRKLMPALYTLVKNGLMSKNFVVVGASRKAMDDDRFRDDIKGALKAAGKLDDGVWDDFAKRLFYRPVDYADKGSYRAIKDLLDAKEKEFGTRGNKIFYLATPPSVYPNIIESVALSGLSAEALGWSRLVIEKPHGRDLESSRELSRIVHSHFREEQVYRIDHYLGKETVQNIMMLRFANSIFEPIWNRRYIEHIQITVAESLGVEKRAGYFEQAGVMRDMLQNHMLQVLALAALEPPSVYQSELVREERVKVLRALRPVPLDRLDESLVIGQYVEGEVDGDLVPGYREEEGVARDSLVPTYAALKIYIDNWRWQGVPIYLRSGKRMKNRFSQVTIQFKQVPHLLFRETLKREIGPNALVLRLQPDERVQLKFHTKNPGARICLRDVVMDFSYTEGYQGVELDAYERVLLDCMLGDKMLFIRSDGMDLSWSFITPVLQAIEEGGRAPELNIYRAGTWGPTEADKFMQRDGRAWVNG